MHRDFEPNGDLKFLAAGPFSYRYIYGRVMGKFVTLINCTITSSNRTFDDPMTDTTIHAKRALIGDEWPDDNEFTYDQARIVLWDQDAWTGWPELEFDYLEKSFRGLNPREVELSCSEGHLSLRQEFRWQRQNRESQEFTLRSELHIHLPKPVSYEDFGQRWLAPLKFMITASTGRSTGVRSLRLRNNSWLIDGNRLHPSRGWLQMQVPYPTRPREEFIRATALYRRSDFPEDYDYDQVFTAARRNRFSIDQYANIKSGSSGGSLTQFTAIAQALEALDRLSHPESPEDDQENWRARVDQFLKEQGARRGIRNAAKYALRNAHRESLEGRLSRLSKETGGIIDTLLPGSTWPGEVARARNVVAHGLETTDLLMKDLGGIFAATEICLLLFELRWLTLIGCTPERANELSTRRGYYQPTIQAIQANYPALATLASRQS